MVWLWTETDSELEGETVVYSLDSNLQDLASILNVYTWVCKHIYTFFCWWRNEVYVIEELAK